jgi:hypothetical protein
MAAAAGVVADCSVNDKAARHEGGGTKGPLHDIDFLKEIDARQHLNSTKNEPDDMTVDERTPSAKARALAPFVEAGLRQPYSPRNETCASGRANAATSHLSTCLAAVGSSRALSKRIAFPGSRHYARGGRHRPLPDLPRSSTAGPHRVWPMPHVRRHVRRHAPGRLGWNRDALGFTECSLAGETTSLHRTNIGILEGLHDLRPSLSAL